MALVYDRKDINIEYYSKTIPDDKYNKKLIIYPVLKYKVYAPILEDIKLNLFQKAVLSVLNKGNHSIQEISQWLKLDKLLIQTILAELQNKGFYDASKHYISEKGRELIEGKFSWFANAENLRQDIRYIYQDVYTHKLYPVLMDIEQDNAKMYLKSNKFHFKTMGKHDIFDYDLIEPQSRHLRSISRPNNDDVFDAINKHVQTYISNSEKDIKEKPNAIQFLDNEPHLVFISSWIFIDKNNGEIEEFEVKDPFNVHEEAFWLKEGIEKSSDVLESLVLDVREKENKEKSSSINEMQKEVEKDISKKFDNTIIEHDNIYKSLCEFYLDLKFYKHKNSGKFLKDAFRQSQIILETLFHDIYQRHKDGYKKVLMVDEKLENLFVTEITKKLFSINSNCKVPDWKYKKFTPNLIKPALNKPNKASLRALYVGAILASWHDNHNPMYNLIKQKNDLLLFFEKIADERNKVGHKYHDVKDNEITDYSSKVEEAKLGIEEIITIFLEGNR